MSSKRVQKLFSQQIRNFKVNHFKNSKNRPLVLVACCFWEGQFLHASKQGSGDKYIRAAAQHAGVLPLLVPALSECYGTNWIDDVFHDSICGVMLTGSPSNIHPSHYGVEETEKHPPYDERRDQISFGLIKGALDRNIPILGVCRGHQELNVYFGGTLNTNIQNETTYHGFPTDVSADESIDKDSMEYQDVKYGPAHSIKLSEGGWLHNGLGKNEIIVNSCHYQGIGKLADPLFPEAVAPDGLVEAVSLRDTSNFVLGVQFHPEYKTDCNSDSQKIYTLFGDAVRDYQKGSLLMN